MMLAQSTSHVLIILDGYESFWDVCVATFALSHGEDDAQGRWDDSSLKAYSQC